MGNVVIIWDTDTQEETPYGGDGSGWRKWKPCFPQTRRQWGLPETERTMARSPLEVKGVQVLLTLWFWASCFLNSETVYLSLVPLFMVLDRAALKLNQRWKCKEKEDSRLLGLDSQQPDEAEWGTQTTELGSMKTVNTHRTWVLWDPSGRGRTDCVGVVDRTLGVQK